MKSESQNTSLAKKLSNFDFAMFYNKYGTIFIFVVIFIIAALSSKVFLKPANLTNVVRQLVVVTLLAFGETFIIILGHIDVSVGSVLALTGCISASVMSKTQNIFLAILVGLALGTLIGLINGLVITGFKIPAFIMTLAMTTVARGAVLLFTNGIPITDLGNFSILGQGNLGVIPISVMVFAFFLFLSYILLNKTIFGRHVFACGGNKSAAIASGINADRVVIMAFVYNGILTASAGIMLMSRINSGQPASGVGYEFEAITAVVVGGTSLMGGVGNIFGTFIGAMIVGIINNILNLLNVSSYWQQIARGLIIAIAVILDVKTKTVKVKKKI